MGRSPSKADRLIPLEQNELQDLKDLATHTMRTLTLIASLLLIGCQTPSETGTSPFSSAPQRLLSSHAGEGPAWHPDWGGLLFSGDGDITRLADGAVETFRKNAGSNGLLFDAQHRLLICEPVQRRVTRLEQDGQLTVLTDHYEGKRYNQPNDITVDGLGRIYFSDPRYGNRENMEILDDQGSPIEGVYRIDLDGSVSRIITHEVDRPNGLLVTPDDQHLYVADNNNQIGGARKLWRFDLTPQGTVKANSQRLIFDWKTGRGPDGMAIDENGFLYVAGGRSHPNLPHETAEPFLGGVYVFAPSGKRVDFVPIPHDEVTNCSFGGDDLNELYITAGGTLWRIHTHTPGVLAWKN